jgi:hypothetical protein
MVCEIHNMLESQQWAGDQPQLVSATRRVSLTEYTLTVAWTRDRSEISDPASHIHVQCA